MYAQSKDSITDGMPYPDGAMVNLDPKVVHFNHTGLDDGELMLVDAVDPEAGQLLQRTQRKQSPPHCDSQGFAERDCLWL